MRPAETNAELSAPAQGLVELARQELGELSARRRAEGLLKLKARYAPHARRRPILLASTGLLLVGLAMAGGYRCLLTPAPQALSYHLQGGRIDATGLVQSTGVAEPALRFSDGTQVTFLAGAHGRLKSVSHDGARIELNGPVEVAVVKKPQGHWLFDAGPFAILVTGTAFKAEWSDSAQRLDVQLRTGTVQVTGASLAEPIELKAGQRLVVSAREKEVAIGKLELLPPAKPADSAQPHAPPSPAPSARAEPALQGANAVASSTSHWSAELRAGHFAVILQEAEQRGLDQVLAQGSSEDLAALSDAARYSRRDSVARRGLTAQRQRFPRSARANDAAFLLGRLEEAAQHPEPALAWYELCLDESPRGTYASEALGRKMTLVQRLHGGVRARPIAQEYLRQFENGTYAAAAHALLRAH